MHCVINENYAKIPWNYAYNDFKWPYSNTDFKLILFPLSCILRFAAFYVFIEMQ